MEKVTSTKYYEVIRNFVNTHDVQRVDTSPLENGTYHKIYYCSDGATGWEMNRYVTKTLKDCQYTHEWEILETEWYSTDTKSIIMEEVIEYRLMNKYGDMVRRIK